MNSKIILGADFRYNIEVRRSFYASKERFQEVQGIQEVQVKSVNFPMASVALCPPNPKLFERT